jgi:ABC-type nitrate/sulfonate/bicarbonate transport system substrate-binding protein
MGVDTINAVLTQQADTGIAADYVAVNSVVKGDLVIIATLSRGDDESAKENKLLVKGNANSPSDLKGKKLGVNKGTVNEYVWSKYLEANSISKDKVTFVPYSTPDEAIVGMQKGDIEAVWQGGALTDKFLNIEGVHQLDDLVKSGVRTDSYLLADRNFAEENKEQIVNALKALNKGISYVDENLEETAELAYQQLKLPKDDVLKDLERNNYVLGFTDEDVEHLNQMKDWLLENGLIQDDFNLEQKLFLDPLKEAVPESVNLKN